MGVNLRSWRQQIKRYRVAIRVVVSVLVVIIVLIIAVFLFGWDWIGLNGGYSKVTITRTPQGITTATEKAPGKTLWDWMQLLIIPIALTIAGLLYNFVRDRTDRSIAHDDRQEAVLQEYVDKMSELLLDKDLDSKPDAKYAARMRTLAVLSRLDTIRKRRLLQFLYETGFNNTNIGKSAIDLSSANLSQINLSSANLNGIVLKGANLSGSALGGANLSMADLSTTNLSMADLSTAKLNGADLTRTNLSGANLSTADLSTAKLIQADLSTTNLSMADLSEADLSGAKLDGARLIFADLTRTNLSGANLSGANLSGAKLYRAIGITREQLDKAISQGANVTNGEMHP